MAVALGVDWIVVDAEHGYLDWKEVLEHVRATVRSDTVALVRVAALDAGLIKRALDIGADGVVVPWIETAEQLRKAVAFAAYPPEGVRGIGPERATGWGECIQEHAKGANESVLVVPVIETVAAGRTIEELSQVPGTEIFFLGPANYSASAGFRGEWEGPGVAAELLRIQAGLRRAGKYCGVMATSHEDLVERWQQGFGLLGLGTDSGLLLRSLHGALAAVGRDRPIHADFIPEAETRPAIPLRQLPASLKPDRLERMNQPGTAPSVLLAEGITFDCHVGRHNGARGLTTGIVHFERERSLAWHMHACTEAITVLRGSMAVSVEGREYLLGPFDNIVIPREIAHVTRNASKTEAAAIHVAFGSETVDRQLCPDMLSEPVSENFHGVPGKEHVTLLAKAPRSQAGPGTGFVDYFNQRLNPGIEMSGGYALFQPGGRLPAHVHYFDESISIVQGRAVCKVEGRVYQIEAPATAMIPKGRVHYFVNSAEEEMAMIWVYAGPSPDRIVVDEICALTERTAFPRGNS
jgi:2-dehydro-3-deoxyglucarate aldolase/4-hydroxy-2-oxoheptanedioate aldolase